jgi:hypothetical protein
MNTKQLVTIALVAAAAYGVYWYVQKRKREINSPVTNNQVAPVAPTPAQQVNGTAQVIDSASNALDTVGSMLGWGE